LLHAAIAATEYGGKSQDTITEATVDILTYITINTKKIFLLLINQWGLIFKASHTTSHTIPLRLKAKF